MSTANITNHVLIFDDVPANRNPIRRVVDWARQAVSIPVAKGLSEEVQIPPFSAATLFDGTRALGSNGSTAFNLVQSPLETDRYRLQWTGAGASPAFRTDRGVDLSSGTAILALQPNLTMVVTSSLGAAFTGVVPGDVVLIPGPSTGDTGPFDPLNEGLWTVLAASTTQITMLRPSGSVFSGTSQTVNVAAASQFQVFTAAGVQLGDTVDISAGFAVTTQHSYTIVAVTPSSVDFISPTPLALESAVVPGVSGLKVYSAAKRLVHLETDQEVAVRYNGDTTNLNIVAPIVPADPTQVGYCNKWGVVYTLVVFNRAATTANVLLISAE